MNEFGMERLEIRSSPGSESREEIMERLMAASVVRPEQFSAIWGGGRTLTPGQKLALAVLDQSIRDLRRFRWARRRRNQRRYLEAYEWILSTDDQWMFSFESVCDLLGIPADSLRSSLLAEDRGPARIAA